MKDSAVMERWITVPPKTDHSAIICTTEMWKRPLNSLYAQTNCLSLLSRHQRSVGKEQHSRCPQNSLRRQ